LILHPLFHWSPAARRPGILRYGLRVNEQPTCDTVPWDRVCCCMSPSHAWALSAAMFGNIGEEWDLWQVQLDKNDDVRPECFTGNVIGEIRVHNAIPRSRIWYVGSRHVPEGIELVGR
jgi:hypothetical protein